ncbi:hypothetical protein [Kitasatospora sp. NPDC001683]
MSADLHLQSALSEADTFRRVVVDHIVTGLSHPSGAVRNQALALATEMDAAGLNVDPDVKACGQNQTVRQPRQRLIELEPQETSVLARVAWGWDMPAISKALDITVNAARTVNQAVHRKLGASNAAHAVALAIGLGLLPADVATNPATKPGGHDGPVR